MHVERREEAMPGEGGREGGIAGREE